LKKNIFPEKKNWDQKEKLSRNLKKNKFKSELKITEF